MFFLEFDEDINMGMNMEVVEETKFKKISNKSLKTQSNPLFTNMHEETSILYSYFEDKINTFKDLFEKDLKTLDNTVDYLESNALSHNGKCTEIIDSLPGWKCLDCSELDSIYCSNCYIKSKNLHKGHKIHYLPKSEKTTGRCDCGDPNNLKVFCPEHKESFKDMKEIDEFIEKSFPNDILPKLNSFFDELFLKFSQYLILGEQCNFFRWDILQFETFTEDEKNDISLLKDNFCVVFQNFLTFLYIITSKNMGMLYLVSKYFLNNYLNKNPVEKFKICHTCAKLENKKIEIIKENEKESESDSKHDCKCPFLRLLLSNWRDKVKPKNEKENQNRKLLLLFTHNIFFKEYFSLFYFFIFKEILFNDNEDIMHERSAFISENDLYLIGTQTDIIESAYTNFYEYLKEILNNPKVKDSNGGLNSDITKKIMEYFKIINDDLNNFLRPKMKELISKKNNLVNIFLNIVCLIHNQCEYKSIYPHPQFQDKTLSFDALELVLLISRFASYLCSCFQWEKIEKLKEIYKYIIYKILNQEKEGIIQLGENEFSCHLSLYRFFGSFMNAFCFNYSFMKNCTILESINYFKNNFFDSKEQIQQFCDIILNDYFKFFGLIGGTNNNFFNYYDKINVFYTIFFQFIYVHDSTLLKYIFLLNENNIDINSYLKKSNIENIYSTFDNIFNKGITFKNEENIEPKEEEEKKSEEDNTLINGLTDIINRQYATREEQNFAIRRLLYDRNNNNYKSKDDNNILMQWEFLIQLLIYIIKSDSCFYNNLIDNYKEIISSKTKTDLFNNVTNNKYAKKKKKNILQEKIIHILIKKLEKKMDNYLMILFEQNDTFYKILNELTFSKLNEEKTQIFYLKDEYLKCLDCNYYSNNKTKSEAQKYILDFKKDVVKTYNYYYYNQSYLTFEFVEKVYEKVLLDKNNLELISRMIEKLLNDDRIMENLDKKSIRNSLLPLMLNYLSMLSVINTKSFIEFKLQNKDIISKLYDLLFAFVKDNAQKNIIDKDLEDNIKEVLNQMNRYQLIYDYYEGDLSKLNKYDFNTNILEKLKQEEKSKINNINLIQISDENNKNKKTKLKNAMRIKKIMKKKLCVFIVVIL